MTQPTRRPLTTRNKILLVLLSLTGMTLLQAIGANTIGAVIVGAVLGTSVFYNLRSFVRQVEARRTGSPR